MVRGRIDGQRRLAPCCGLGLLARFGMFAVSLIVLTLMLWGTAHSAADGDRPAISDGTLTVSRVLVTSIRETEVPAQVAGSLAEVSIRVGQRVRAGDLLARIDDTEARMSQGLAEVEAEIAALEADGDPLVEAAEAAYEVAKNNLRRAKDSLANFQRSISEAEMDDYRLKATETKTALWEQRRTLQIAALTKRLRQQQLELSEDFTRRHQIRAPGDGMIKQLHRQPGEWVVPGQEITTILMLRRLRCVGFVDADLVRAAGGRAAIQGRAATLIVGGPESLEFPGEVTFVDAEVEPESDQVKIWVEVDNAALQLRPGDRGSLRIDWPAGEPPQ